MLHQSQKVKRKPLPVGPKAVTAAQIVRSRVSFPARTNVRDSDQESDVSVMLYTVVLTAIFLAVRGGVFKSF